MMKTDRLISIVRGAITLALLIVLAGGCASRRRAKYEINEEVLAPKPPAFLVGPAAVFLTNSAGFSARVTLDAAASLANKTKPLTGQLLGQGSHLLFSATGSDRTFVWDAGERSGYVISEALQGYSPMSSPVQVTNIATLSETAGPAGQRVNGHPGHEAQFATALNDGTSATFKLWRASDLNGFPARIETVNATPPFVLDLADFRPAKLSPKLFLPPEGFTKYDNAEAMTGELVMRKAKLRSVPAEKPREDLPAPTRPARSY